MLYNNINIQRKIRTVRFARYVNGRILRGQAFFVRRVHNEVVPDVRVEPFELGVSLVRLVAAVDSTRQTVVGR